MILIYHFTTKGINYFFSEKVAVNVYKKNLWVDFMF